MSPAEHDDERTARAEHDRREAIAHQEATEALRTALACAPANDTYPTPPAVAAVAA